MGGCGKNPKPCPFFACTGVFALQRAGEGHSWRSIPTVLVEKGTNFAQLLLKGRDGSFGEDRHPVLAAFALSDHNLSICEIDILDPQPHALHQSQPASIEEHPHERPWRFKSIEQSTHLPLGKNHGKPYFNLGPCKIPKLAGLKLQNAPVKKHDGIECLVLSGRGDTRHDRKTGEKLPDFWGSHLPGMAFVVKQDELANPLDVSLLCAQAVMEKAQGVADLIEEPPLGGGSG